MIVWFPRAGQGQGQGGDGGGAGSRWGFYRDARRSGTNDTHSGE